MTLRHSIGIAACAALLGAVFGSAQAAEIKGSGTNVYVPTSRESVSFSDETSLLRSDSQSVLIADDPKLLFNFQAQDCRGSYLLDKDEQIVNGAGYCDSIDNDGDVWMIWWKTTGEDGAWGVLGGSGKYEGMTGGGTSKILSQHNDGRFVLRWEGTWQMK